MGFFSGIKDFFSGKSDEEKIADLASEADRYADRYDNADMAEAAAMARDYAGRIRRSGSLAAARALFAEFKLAIKKYDEDEEDDSYRSRRRYDDDTRYSDDS